MADKGFLTEQPDYTLITDQTVGIPLAKGFRKGWLLALGIAFFFFLVFQWAVTWLFVAGVGIWGINIPVGWGYAIVNFVWWIGIGHAGTFISAFLYLLHQNWRASINRFAETITLFAVMCAGLFPLLHLGRPYKFYWMIPYPNVMALWPQFRSPLVWDMFAVFTYLTVSVLFWYMGIIPDLASARDRATKTWVKKFYGILCLGWRGAGRHWKSYKTVYLLMAGLATPLVISVHTVVSFDFASAILPGWHSTIFPPYFVAGAIFSGFAMVFTLMLPVRKFYGLSRIITLKHLDVMSKVMLVNGLIVAYGYVMEIFTAFYSGNFYESYHIKDLFSGSYSILYWIVIFCNVISIQTLWFAKVRQSPLLLFILSLVINTGMWLERFVIVIGSLYHDYLPSSWAMYAPTFWDWATLLGSMGLFMVCILIFLRVFPMVASFEVKEMASKIKNQEN